MKTVVYVGESGVKRVLTDTPGSQVLVLDGNIDDYGTDIAVSVDQSRYSLESMEQGVARHAPAEVAQAYAGAIYELQRNTKGRAVQMAKTLSAGLQLDFCASGSGECSCAKFADDPSRCSRGIEVAIEREQALEAEYTFDEVHLGTSNNGRKTVTTTLVPRPAGLSNVDWYAFAGQMCELLNRQRGAASQ